MRHEADLLTSARVTEGRALRLALMESRQRWRQFGALATDLAFETDRAGHLTFLAPDTVLGWPVTELLGRPLRWLLEDPDGPDPFGTEMQLRRQRTWFRTRGGGRECLAVTMVPMTDEAGRRRGFRGVGVAVTERERADAARSAALRRGQVLDHILAHMRQEIMAPRMMEAILEDTVPALGCAGVAVLDLAVPEAPEVVHSDGAPLPALGSVVPVILSQDEATRTFVLDDGTQVVACRCSTRFGDRAALLGWRQPGGRAWDEDDLVLAASVTGVIRIVLEHSAIQRELARQARTDPLTGLLNRRAFIDEATRRIDRLERDGLPGTLLFVDLDRLKQLNDRAGHEAGDSALLVTAALLQRTFRPGDLVARLGGDEFAVWLDGADSLTAAERAEALRLATPAEFAHLCAGDGDGVSLSIGIAMRDAGSDDTLEALIQRADSAMYAAKRAGRGQWRVGRQSEAA